MTRQPRKSPELQMTVHGASFGRGATISAGGDLEPGIITLQIDGWVNLSQWVNIYPPLDALRLADALQRAAMFVHEEEIADDER